MSDQPAPLDRRTLEAIADEFDRVVNSATSWRDLVDHAVWAAGHIRCKLESTRDPEQPESIPVEYKPGGLVVTSVDPETKTVTLQDIDDEPPVNTKPGPLHPATFKAIAERFRAQRNDYTCVVVGKCSIGSMAKWAEQFVRGMAQEAKQPEPPAAEPSAGAMRAARAYVSKVDIYAPAACLAAIIDSETGLPKLLAACRVTATKCHRQWCSGKGKDGCNCDVGLAQAALAEHDSKPTTIERKTDAEPHTQDPPDGNRSHSDAAGPTTGEGTGTRT